MKLALVPSLVAIVDVYGTDAMGVEWSFAGRLSPEALERSLDELMHRNTERRIERDRVAVVGGGPELHPYQTHALEWALRQQPAYDLVCAPRLSAVEAFRQWCIQQARERPLNAINHQPYGMDQDH